DVEHIGLALHVFRAGVEDDGKQSVLVGVGNRHVDDALALEQIGHAAGTAHVAAAALEDLADFAVGAITVVGEDVDEHGHAARAETLIGDLLKGHALNFARAGFDGPLDVVLGHADGPRLIDGVAQLEVHGRIAAAVAGGNDDGPAQLAPQLAALGVDGPLLVL